jgi:hypothetical protein
LQSIVPALLINPSWLVRAACCRNVACVCVCALHVCRSDSVANRYLKAASWNVEQAVNNYYDSPPSPKPVARGAFDDKAASDWFDTYRDISLSGEKFSVDGIQSLASDIGIDPNDPVLFVFAWKCNCQTICEFTKQEFLTGLKTPEIKYVNSSTQNRGQSRYQYQCRYRSTIHTVEY